VSLEELAWTAIVEGEEEEIDESSIVTTFSKLDLLSANGDTEMQSHELDNIRQSVCNV